MVVTAILIMGIVLIRNVILYNQINDRLKEIEWSDEDITNGKFL